MLNWVRTVKRLHGTVQYSTVRCHCVNNLLIWIKASTTGNRRNRRVLCAQLLNGFKGIPLCCWQPQHNGKANRTFCTRWACAKCRQKFYVKLLYSYEWRCTYVRSTAMNNCLKAVLIPYRKCDVFQLLLIKRYVTCYYSLAGCATALTALRKRLLYMRCFDMYVTLHHAV